MLKHSISRLAALGLVTTVAHAFAFNPQPDPPAKFDYQVIDLSGAVNTYAYGINNAGTIVGYSDDGVTIAHGFIRHGASVTGYDVPAAVGIFSEIYAINNSGRIAGAYYDGVGLFGFTHDTGAPVKLDPGGIDVFAFGINDTGSVVGRHAGADGVPHGWLWNGSSFSDVDRPGAERTIVRDIDNTGRMVGYSGDAAGMATHAFIRDAGGFTDIDVPGALGTLAFGINERGWLVGEWFDANTTHGLLIRGDHSVTIDIPGAAFTEVTGVNDDGTLVGLFGDADHVHFHAFTATLTPVPEPSTWALFALGLPLLTLRRRVAVAVAGLAAAVLTFTAPLAQAAADHSVRAAVTARGFNSSQSQDTGAIDGPTATAGPVGFSVVDAFGSFSNGITATASYGHLYGQANAAQNSPVFVRQSDASTDLLQFLDRITLTSASLAAGTLVDLTVTMVLTDRLSAGPTTCCSNVGVNGLLGLSGLNAGDQAGPAQSIDHTKTVQASLKWLIGAPNDIGGRMFFDAGSSPGVNSFTGGSQVDMADALFYLTLPSGVGLVSASGAAYAATPAVPEPASAWLLALGSVAGLVARRLRRPRA